MFKWLLIVPVLTTILFLGLFFYFRHWPAKDYPVEGAVIMGLAGMLVGFMIILAASFATWAKHNNIMPRDAIPSQLGNQSGQISETAGEVVRILPTGLDPVIIVPYDTSDIDRTHSGLN